VDAEVPALEAPGGDETVGQRGARLAPASRQVDQHDAPRLKDPGHLGNRLAPVRDQVEHVRRHGRPEGAGGERKRRGIGHPHRERRAAAGLLKKLLQHPPGDVDTHHPHTGPVERDGDPSCAHADLEARAATVHGRDEHGGHLGLDLPRVAAGAVVVPGCAVEIHGLRR
jgi:hypothetical protein